MENNDYYMVKSVKGKERDERSRLDSRYPNSQKEQVETTVSHCMMSWPVCSSRREELAGYKQKIGHGQANCQV